MIPPVLLVEDACSVAKLKSGSSSCSELMMTVVSSLDEVALISSDDVREEPSPSEFEAESVSKNIFVLPFRFDKCNNSLKQQFKSKKKKGKKPKSAVFALKLFNFGVHREPVFHFALVWINGAAHLGDHDANFLG